MDASQVPTAAPLRAGRTGRTRTRALGVACAALMLALAMGVGGLIHWIQVPPPTQPIRAPQLPVARPGDLLVWSPDGTQLLAANRRGQASVVHFPSRHIEPLPRFPQPPWDAGFDAAGDPLLLRAVNFMEAQPWRLDRRSGKWSPAARPGIQGKISPDGRWFAGVVLRPGHLARSLRPGDPQWLMLTDLRTRAETRLALPPSPMMYSPGLHWDAPGLLRVELYARGSMPTFLLDPVRRRLRPVRPRDYLIGQSIIPEYEARPLPGGNVRRLLRSWHVPGVQRLNLADWRLAVVDRYRKRLASIPVGRRSTEGWRSNGNYFTWKSAAISPDERYVAFLAADDTLRLWDRETPAR